MSMISLPLPCQVGDFGLAKERGSKKGALSIKPKEEKHEKGEV